MAASSQLRQTTPAQQNYGQASSSRNPQRNTFKLKSQGKRTETDALAKKDSSMNAGSLSTAQRRTSSKANDPAAVKRSENKNDNKDDKGHADDKQMSFYENGWPLIGPGKKQNKYYNEAYTFEKLKSLNWMGGPYKNNDVQAPIWKPTTEEQEL